MKDICAKIIELLEENRVSALATITRQAGSSPRGVGTKMLFLEDGSYVGTIGGGLLEKIVMEKSADVLKTLTPLRFEHRMEGKEIDEAEMTCGGNVEIFIEPVFSKNSETLNIFEEITDIFARGGAGLIATVIDSERWSHGHEQRIFINKNGERKGALAGLEEICDAVQGEMDRYLGERSPLRVVLTDANENPVKLFIEPVISDPAVYIFGGGHVSKQIVPLAAKVGFRVVVIDDRPEFSDSRDFPEAAEVYTYSFDGAVHKLPVNEFSYLVIVTRGHSHDKTVLDQALKTPARYVGMIGSRKKLSLIFAKLLEQGFTQDDINRIHSPIGLEIGAETPEEIAVSITAELIKVRAGL